MSMDADRLGQAMYDAVNALAAGATEADVKARFIAQAQAIIDEITANATIAPLPGTHAAIIGTSPHVHPTITSLEATGKIS